jgi:environmental stress-induced protein Ves
MSAFRVIRATDRKVTPWKNGQGWTAEVVVFPAGATLETFDWRISFAGTNASGPFSIFPGVDRTLAVLEGRIELSIEGRAPIEMSASSLPVSFPGDVATSARLIEGPLRDLNVMTRRGCFVHDVQRLELKQQSEFQNISAIVGRYQRLMVRSESQVEALSMDDVALFLKPTGAVTISPESAGEIFVVELSPLLERGGVDARP